MVDTVASALQRANAPREAIVWAEPFGDDFLNAWWTCPHASWIAYLALAARVPFRMVLSALVGLDRAYSPGTPAECGARSERLAQLRSVAATKAFKDQERAKTIDVGPAVADAYTAAIAIVDEIERGMSPTSIIVTFRASLDLDDVLEGNRRVLRYLGNA